MQVAVVILNWNGKTFLEQYLPSVVKYTLEDKSEVQDEDLFHVESHGQDQGRAVISPASLKASDTLTNAASSGALTYQIVVADNGSTDDSHVFLQQHYPQVRYIQLDKNYGFAEGYNRALQQIDATYTILLNSDVEVTPGWLPPLVERMESDSHIGACMPKLKALTHRTQFEYAGAAGGFIDQWGYTFCRGRLFECTETDNGQYNSPTEVFWATGACCMVRTELYKKMGGLDAHFFAHMEEIDFCWRLKNSGYAIWYEPRSTVYHLGGGTLPQTNPFKAFLNYRNNLFLLYKNLPSNRVFITITIRMILDGVSGLYALLQGDTKLLPSICKAHWAFYQSISHYHDFHKTFPRPKHLPSQMIRKSIVWAHFIYGKKSIEI